MFVCPRCDRAGCRVDCSRYKSTEHIHVLKKGHARHFDILIVSRDIFLEQQYHNYELQLAKLCNQFFFETTAIHLSFAYKLIDPPFWKIFRVIGKKILHNSVDESNKVFWIYFYISHMFILNNYYSHRSFAL